MLTEDTRTERFLSSIGAKWKYSNDVTFDEMSPDWDKINLGRSQVKIDSAITEYGMLMDKGSPAPAPIIWKNPESDYYEVLDGIQRLLAVELRKPSAFSAYVVRTDSKNMIKKIRVFANLRLQGGHQESAEWTLEKAVTLLVRGRAATIEEVAELGGWSPSAVRAKKAVIECREAIQGCGGPDRLPDTIVKQVAKHAQRGDFAAAPSLLAGFFNDLKKIKLPADEAAVYIEDFFEINRPKGKQFDQFSKKLEEFRDDEEISLLLADPTRRRHQSMTAEGKLLKSLKSTLTTVTRIIDDGEPISEMAEYFQLSNNIRKGLSQIEKYSKKK